MTQRKLSTTDEARGSGAARRPLGTTPKGLGASALALAVAFLAPKPAAAVPFFEDLTATKVPAADPSCAISSKAGCYTSWLVATDLDGDGDMDMLLANGGGYYKPDFLWSTSNLNPPASIEPSTVYLNDGLGNFTDVTGPLFGGAASRLRQVGVADVNGDGLKDVFQPGGYGKDLDKLFIQTASGVFENQAAELLPPGSMSNTPGFHLGDLDGDGDVDIVTTDWSNAQDKTLVFLSLYLNDGTGKFTLAEEQQDPDNWLPSDHFPPTIPGTQELGVYWGTRAIDLDFADIDNDFDLDILVNMRNGISRILLNDGTAHFEDGNGKASYSQDKLTGANFYTSESYPGKRGPYVYNQEVCDFDNDGDLDMLLDNAGARPPGGSGNYSQVLVNDGKGHFTDETRERIFGEPGADDNAVKCVDLNNDGSYDLLVASLGRTEKVLLADGTGKFNYLPDGIPAVSDASLGIDAADFDGDGLFDVWTGQGEAGNFQKRYYHGIAAPDGTGAKIDTRPPVFRAIEKPTAIEGKPIIVRVAVKDAVTSETGDMVKDVSVVYLPLGGTGGKVTAKFIGGDLFRAEISAQPAYTVVSVTPQATDRRDQKGYGSTVTVTVAPLVDGSGGGGAGGSSAGGSGSAGGGASAGTAAVEGGAGGEPTIPDGVAGEPTEPGVGGMPDPGTGGTDEPGTSGASTGATSGRDGSGATPSSSGGTANENEGGSPSPSTGGTAVSSGSSGDDGCSVSTTAPAPRSGGWLAALGLALVAGGRRRRRE
jgi:MYXO-CTERM domain-containing protein